MSLAYYVEIVANSCHLIWAIVSINTSDEMLHRVSVYAIELIGLIACDVEFVIYQFTWRGGVGILAPSTTLPAAMSIFVRLLSEQATNR